MDSQHADRAIASDAGPHWLRRALPWLLALLPFLLLALWRSNSGPGLEADDYAQYMMHGQALAEGRSYGDIAYIYSPYARWIGPRMAMPGLPIVIAAVQTVFGPNVSIMKAAMLCFALAFITISALYFARHAEWYLGLGVALLCGLSPGIIHASTQLLTDLPFAALVWAAVYVMDYPGKLSWQRLAAVTLLGGAALLFRTAGLALIPALLLFAIVRYREHGLRPLVPLLVWGGALVLGSVLLDLRETTVLRLSPERFFVWLKASQFGLRNGLDYAQALVDSHLQPFPWPRANDVFHLATVLVMLIGLGAWVFKTPVRFGVLFLLTYGGLLLIAPVGVTRYIWPLFPFFVFGLLNGIRTLTAWALAHRIEPRTATLVFAGLLTLGGVRAVIAQPRPGNLLELPDVVAVIRYLEDADARQPVRASFFKPRSLALATGIPTMGPITGQPECILAELDRKRITHVIVGATSARESAKARLKQVVPARPDLFTLELSTPTFKVYSFHGPAGVPQDAQRDCPVH